MYNAIHAAAHTYCHILVLFKEELQECGEHYLLLTASARLLYSAAFDSAICSAEMIRTDTTKLLRLLLFLFS
jgi:hypothetical protein